jgi:polysaccharide biosynthesis transport protein
MLQRNKTRAPAYDYDDRLDAAENSGLNELAEFAIGFARRQYQIILLALVLASGVGFIYLRTTPAVYTAQASIIIDPPRSTFVQQQGLLNDPIQVESQIEIIRSKAVASAVVKELNLTNDSEFMGSDGGGLLQTLSRRILGTAESKLDPLERVTAAFLRQLKVDRVEGSWVIQIGFTSRTPERAAQIANATANAYILDQLDAKYQANRTATSWLQERIQQLGVQATAAQRAVEEFKGKNNIVSADGKLLDDQQVGELNSRLVAARGQTADLSARLSRLKTILSAGSADANLEAVTGVETSPIFTGLRQQYLELARRESDWSARFGRDHLAVVNLRTRMQEIRTSMLEELRRYAEATKNDYELAQGRQEEMEKQLTNAVSRSRTTGQAQVTLRELESSATGYRNLYDSFLQRYMGSAQQETFPITEARVISPASPPLNKSKPKSMVVLALSIVGGLGLGLGLGMLREILDHVFRTGARLEEVLQTSCIALVPLLRAQTPSLREKLLNRRYGNHDHNLAFETVINEPLSRFSEAIRSVKLAIDLHLATKASKVFGFTSALPNEGKSSVSVAFARLVAQVGKRVILVDCDLRNPSLSRALAPKATIGILDVISGNSLAKEAILKDSKTNMDFLPVVKKTSLFHTSEILASDAMKKLFDELSVYYDYVVVDLSPLAPVVDVRATTHLLDAYVLVVEWGRTNIDVVKKALSGAPGVYDALLGAVLNKTDMALIERYDGYGSGFYHNGYYGRYGYTE